MALVPRLAELGEQPQLNLLAGALLTEEPQEVMLVAPGHQRCNRELSLHAHNAQGCQGMAGMRVVGLKELLCVLCGDLLELQPPQRTNTIAGWYCNASCIASLLRLRTARTEGGQSCAVGLIGGGSGTKARTAWSSGAPVHQPTAGRYRACMALLSVACSHARIAAVSQHGHGPASCGSPMAACMYRPPAILLHIAKPSLL